MKQLHNGQVVTVKGGKYDGHGAEIRKIYHVNGYAEVKINGKIVRLKLDRLQGATDEQN